MTADRRMSKPRWDREAILSAARQTAKELGYDRLKPEQEEVVLAFVGGQDVFGSLPTGFGKTRALLHGSTFDKLRGKLKEYYNCCISFERVDGEPSENVHRALRLIIM